MKTLVAYFSAGGRTAAAAKKLAAALEAELYEIRPAVPYKWADLNWVNPRSRSSVEMKDISCRPELAAYDADISAYDTVLLGFPIWWYVAPRIINTFLESYDFSEKRIILFATSGSSGFGNTAELLRASVDSSAVISEGRLLNRRNSAAEFAEELRPVLNAKKNKCPVL